MSSRLLVYKWLIPYSHILICSGKMFKNCGFCKENVKILLKSKFERKSPDLKVTMFPGIREEIIIQGGIAHFRVLVCLCVKTSLRGKLFLWKCVSPATSISMQIKLIFMWKVLLEESFWQRGKPELENGLLSVYQCVWWLDPSGPSYLTSKFV